MDKEKSMSGFVLGVLLQAAVVGAEGVPYSQAYKLAEGQNQPLVVLVGAEWCPGCVTMKRSVIPGLIRQGKLRDVQFSVVDTDEDPALARQLMRGTSIPQLIVFTRTDAGWKREQMIGPRAGTEVEAAIARALKTQAKSSQEQIAASDGGVGN
jgi:thioredoxin-like negative regulator of GroEL